ncbi:TPA: hypothetical protein ACK3Q6_003736 [Burkholderia cepacia]|uniref:Uncharacterized protein n=1 Tax=Burkholderia contaminans TaxID=488447 RepID=A0ABD7YFQ3_9BURK|nr:MULTISPECIES: hypothetical protein [Burkholderia]HDV6369977.1 hypothetical protein [Burkholderia cepacia]MBR8290445.1 hypothetical protein [Burkholderia cenocepacia]MBX3826600.1 hypothetical protein [Burkholderia contaminans]MBX3845615.1 hypothetical protein [Burkholderia contaminans]MBX3863914.1 hypothetical protein [Burkholderia contaminans]
MIKHTERAVDQGSMEDSFDGDPSLFGEHLRELERRSIHYDRLLRGIQPEKASNLGDVLLHELVAKRRRKLANALSRQRPAAALRPKVREHVIRDRSRLPVDDVLVQPDHLAIVEREPELGNHLSKLLFGRLSTSELRADLIQELRTRHDWRAAQSQGKAVEVGGAENYTQRS